MLGSNSQALFAYHRLFICLFGPPLYMDMRWGTRPNAGGGGGCFRGPIWGPRSDSRVSCGVLPHTPWATKPVLRQLCVEKSTDNPVVLTTQILHESSRGKVKTLRSLLPDRRPAEYPIVFFSVQHLYTAAAT